MSRWVTGPWLRGARFEGGLLVPGRPRGRTFDLLLTPEHAVLRGTGELILPWAAHLDFVTWETSSEGWYVGGWSGQGGAGAAVDLKGHLEEQSRALPLMRTWSARWARTPIGGGRAPLHRLTPFESRSDKDAVHALCTALTQRADLRPRLADSKSVSALLARITSTQHVRGFGLEGVRRLTIETSNALRALGCVHPVGGRPLPGVATESAIELLPRVLERIRASPSGHGITVDERKVLALIERGYSRYTPWPFEPLFN